MDKEKGDKGVSKTMQNLVSKSMTTLGCFPACGVGVGTHRESESFKVQKMP